MNHFIISIDREDREEVGRSRGEREGRHSTHNVKLEEECVSQRIWCDNHMRYLESMYYDT